MIKICSPTRISLFGGGCDFSSYYSTVDQVMLIGFAIDQHSFIFYRKTNKILPYYTIINYSKTEKVKDNSLIQHNGARAALQYFNITDGVEISHLCSVPARTGLGSSSTFLVSLIHAICFERDSKSPSKKELAQHCINIEQNILKFASGIQDSIWSSYGGFNSIEIKPNGNFFVRPMPLSPEFIDYFYSHLALFYIGPRKSFEVASSVDSCQESVIIHKNETLAIAKEAYKAFEQENILYISKLLHESWLHKKGVSKLISNTKIDNYYNKGLSLGALSGKVCGSGGGGCILFLVPPEKRQHLIDNMGIPYVDFNFDFDGSKIL